MENATPTIQEVQQQEQELQFTAFTNQTALDLGLMLIDKAKKEHKRIAIDITRHGQQLFHYAFEGASPDNDRWITRKSKVVNHFSKSSLQVELNLKKNGKDIREVFALDPAEYAASGGAFPITVKGTGVIGTITVSGLSGEEDHGMVVVVLQEYLAKK
jgi:uncharacterized protein (UPF0303 family)